MAAEDLEPNGSLPFAYLTTVGRRTGSPHTVEIWFVLQGGRVTLLSGGGRGSDWVRNLLIDPNVEVRIGDATRRGTARVVEDAPQDDPVRRAMAAKYQGWRQGRPLSAWARTALAVQIELEGAE